MMRNLLILVSLAVFSSAQAGPVIFVDDGCPGPGSGTKDDPYCTIQEAIDAAVDMDEIVVAAGTYNETINFLGKAITVRSSDGPDVTTIDAQGSGTVVVCVTGEGPETVLNGFTITGGSTTGAGGGMAIQGASPSVINCVFSSNTADVGAGLYNQDSNPTIMNCAFVDNTAVNAGGGMYNGGIAGSNPTVTNCAFTNNAAGIGGGMFNQNSDPTLINCTLSGNTAMSLAGGMFNDNSNPCVDNCIIWGNALSQIFNVASSPTVSYSDVQGGFPGVGNINADPRFLEATAGNFRLDRFSPCVDAADNGAVPADTFDLDGDGNSEEPLPVDLDGNPRFFDDDGVADSGMSRTGPPLVDMGAFERQEVSSPLVLHVPGDYPTIQEAIDEAGNGDEIVVAEGIYEETIDFHGKAILLRSSAGAAVTTIDATVIGGSVVTCTSGEGSGTVLQGFTITGGTGTFDGTHRVGGGMNNFLSDATVTDCIFTGNMAELGGGMNNFLSNPTVTGCTFTGNESALGGGMQNSASNPTVTACTFSGNTAFVGGGLYNDISSATATDCSFDGNSATLGGGGGIFNSFFSTSTIVHCTFSDNTASDWLGGGLFNVSSTLTLHNCRFSGNSAREGGGLNVDGSAVTLFGSTFYGNEATEFGGGGVFVGSASTATVVNCTFVANIAPAGILGTAIDSLDSTASLANSIVWNDDLGEDVTATYSDIEGGLLGSGNIDEAPLFVDELSGDLRLSPGSPCIDAANNAAVPADTADLDDDGNVTEPVPFDLDGNPRSVDDPDTRDTGNGDPPVVDMGAYEFQVSVCPWDLDGDDTVGILDLLALLAVWGTDPGGPPDFDGDGTVGILDLLILLANWGPCP